MTSTDFPSASYDEWRTRSPDYYDDPCDEVRREMGAEIDEMAQQIRSLHSVLKMAVDDAPADADWAAGSAGIAWAS